MSAPFTLLALLARFDRAFRAPAPPERLAALRWLIGGYALVYLAVRAVHLQRFEHLAAANFAPVGVVSILAAPLPAWAVRALVASAIAAGAAFVAGYRFRVSGPLFGALLLWVLSYRSSWGMIFHTENLLVLHTIALGLAPAADVWSLDARRRGASAAVHEGGAGGEPRAAPVSPGPDGRYGWPVQLLSAITVATYVIPGVTKLRNSGFDWVTSDILRNYIAFDNVRKIALGDTYAPLGGALVRHRWLFPPLALVTQMIELGAPLALFSRRFARLFCLGAWLFHVGVLATMAILFPYPLLGVAYASFFEVERLPGLLRPRRKPEAPAEPVATENPTCRTPSSQA